MDLSVSFYIDSYGVIESFGNTFLSIEEGFEIYYTKVKVSTQLDSMSNSTINCIIRTELLLTNKDKYSIGDGVSFYLNKKGPFAGLAEIDKIQLIEEDYYTFKEILNGNISANFRETYLNRDLDLEKFKSKILKKISIFFDPINEYENDLLFNYDNFETKDKLWSLFFKELKGKTAKFIMYYGLYGYTLEIFGNELNSRKDAGRNNLPW